MKNLVKLSSILMMTVAFGGCSSSSDSVFPSLFGSDVQERTLNEKNMAEADLSLGKTDFKPVYIATVKNTGTFVGQKVVSFHKELTQLQKSIKANNAELQELRTSVINNALQYHKNIGVLETKLQVGTTPGNPQMYEMLSRAQNNIHSMSSYSAALNKLSTKVSADTANTDYLIEAIHSAYGISGAVDEDHRQLRVLENEASQTSVLMHSLLAEVDSDISHQQKYVNSANNRIASLSDAIRIGSYGVENPQLASAPYVRTSSPAREVSSMSSINGKPLFAVNFSSQNVNYKEGLKQAVSSAVAKKQNVIFDVVAVNPVSGASAQDYASKIFQDIISMNIPAERINLSSKTDAKASSPSVLVFVR